MMFFSCSGYRTMWFVNVDWKALKCGSVGLFQIIVPELGWRCWDEPRKQPDISFGGRICNPEVFGMLCNFGFQSSETPVCDVTLGASLLWLACLDHNNTRCHFSQLFFILYVFISCVVYILFPFTKHFVSFPFFPVIFILSLFIKPSFLFPFIQLGFILSQFIQRSFVLYPFSQVSLSASVTLDFILSQFIQLVSF